ncbi:MAG: hypothetical protein OEZ68_06470 [Gammaproteobacteria bacterium]|nr:hypothetical protein [Gammaproteobacteria bacterium]MDH5800435.1 hypothetical protein [Gammaproteobacteria bacterium]
MVKPSGNYRALTRCILSVLLLILLSGCATDIVQKKIDNAYGYEIKETDMVSIKKDQLIMCVGLNYPHSYGIVLTVTAPIDTRQRNGQTVTLDKLPIYKLDQDRFMIIKQSAPCEYISGAMPVEVYQGVYYTRFNKLIVTKTKYSFNTEIPVLLLISLDDTLSIKNSGDTNHHDFKDDNGVFYKQNIQPFLDDVDGLGSILVYLPHGFDLENNYGYVVPHYEKNYPSLILWSVLIPFAFVFDVVTLPFQAIYFSRH